MMAARHLCQYLLTTQQEGLQYKLASREKEVKVYADASYGGEGARSQTGIIVMMNNQPIIWYSRRQDTVSLSITEAEYIAVCEGAKDAAWVQQLLKELGTVLTPTNLIHQQRSSRQDVPEPGISPQNPAHPTPVALPQTISDERRTGYQRDTVETTVSGSTNENEGRCHNQSLEGENRDDWDFYEQYLGMKPDNEWMDWVAEIAGYIEAELEQGRV